MGCSWLSAGAKSRDVIRGKVSTYTLPIIQYAIHCSMDKVTFASTQPNVFVEKRKLKKTPIDKSKNQIKYRRLLAASWSRKTNQSFPCWKKKTPAYNWLVEPLEISYGIFAQMISIETEVADRSGYWIQEGSRIGKLLFDTHRITFSMVFLRLRFDQILIFEI